MGKNIVTFQVHAGTYDFGINFCITEDLVKAVRYVNWKLERPNDHDAGVTKSDFDCLGKRFYIDGYCPIIWLPNKPKTPEEIGTLSHEIFHVVCDIMRWAHIPLSSSSEEAYCHLIKHITKSFLNKLK